MSAKFERVIVIYKCGCEYYNDSWTSACESDATCPVHKQSIFSERGEWQGGERPTHSETNRNT